jgi:hypothetical protein
VATTPPTLRTDDHQGHDIRHRKRHPIHVLATIPALDRLRPLKQAAIDQEALLAIEQQLMAGAGHSVPRLMMAEAVVQPPNLSNLEA